MAIYIFTRDQLWVVNTYSLLDVQVVLCSVALSHAGGENGTSSIMIERALLVEMHAPGTKFPLRHMQLLDSEILLGAILP